MDQDALIAALKSGSIFAAGLDVMIPEPLNTDSELLKLPNVGRCISGYFQRLSFCRYTFFSVLTPHIGSATVNTRNVMAKLTSENILAGLAGEELITPVHLP